MERPSEHNCADREYPSRRRSGSAGGCRGGGLEGLSRPVGHAVQCAIDLALLVEQFVRLRLSMSRSNRGEAPGRCEALIAAGDSRVGNRLAAYQVESDQFMCADHGLFVQEIAGARLTRG